MNIPIFPFNEYVLALAGLSYGLWITYYTYVLPANAVRPIFAALFIIPSLILLAVFFSPVRHLLADRQWFGKSATTCVRWVVYLWFLVDWLLVVLALVLGATTREIHIIPYLAVSLFCAGKLIRLTYFYK